MKDFIAAHHDKLLLLASAFITGLFGVIIAYIRSMKKSVNGTLAALVAKLEGIAHDSGVREGREQRDRENND